MNCLRWNDGPVKSGRPEFCSVRWRIAAPKKIHVHTHDFAEIFWIEAGSGIHIINGKEIPMARGDLYIIRPEDIHGMTPIGTEAMGWINISLPFKTAKNVQQRYFQKKQECLWKEDPLPSHYKLNDSQINILNLAYTELLQAPQSVYDIDRFLLNLIHLLRSPSDKSETAFPDWLQTALDQIKLPQHFSKGTPALAKLACRCPEHVSRELKKLLHKTPTDIVNEARLSYASTQLATTNKEIIDICYDCGFHCLAHFYKIFKEKFKLSPKKYRAIEHSGLPK